MCRIKSEKVWDILKVLRDFNTLDIDYMPFEIYLSFKLTDILFFQHFLISLYREKMLKYKRAYYKRVLKSFINYNL